MGWGSLEKKLSRGARGMAGAADRLWGVVSGRAGRCGGARRARASGSAGGGWRLRGVEFDDKLEALHFVSNGWKI